MVGLVEVPGQTAALNAYKKPLLRPEGALGAYCCGLVVAFACLANGSVLNACWKYHCSLPEAMRTFGAFGGFWRVWLGLLGYLVPAELCELLERLEGFGAYGGFWRV